MSMEYLLGLGRRAARRVLGPVVRRLRGRRPPPRVPKKPAPPAVVPVPTAPPGPEPRPIVAPTAQPAAFPRRTLSALMCNYNHARYIEKAITAVVTQSRPPDEYLILDDASTDDSVAVIERFAARFPFIKLVRKHKNGGNSRGINELVEMATGDYIHQGAADDFMLPGFIEQAMRLAEEFPHAGIISGEMIHHYEDTGEVLKVEIPGWTTGYVSPEKYLHEYLEVGDPTCTLSATTLFRRDAFLSAGGMRPELGIWDVSFVLQASALRHGMCYLNAPVYTWVCRPSGLTRKENVDLGRSVETYQNYARLMRSPEFRDLFSEKFVRMWLLANMQHASTMFTAQWLENLFEGEQKEDRAAA